MAMTHNSLKHPDYLSFLTVPSVIFYDMGGARRDKKASFNTP
jgi:hypothetical protein